VWNKFLLLIEMAALLGFILLALRLFASMRTLNEDSRVAMTQPTPAPTPLIQAAVLPGGHTPPDAQRNSEPAPIPAHLRTLVAAISAAASARPRPEQAQRICHPFHQRGRAGGGGRLIGNP
jgi:sortase A